MDIQEQIITYISSLPDEKRSDMEKLHKRILETLPGCRLWFDTGINDDGKVVTNPTVGYGFYTIKYADGKTKDFFQAGISANTSGITVYVMGIKDRAYLANTYGKAIGKASVTAYCFKLKNLGDIDINVLLTAITDGVAITGKPD